MASVLIVYGTTGGHTRRVAGRIASVVSEYGHAATLVDAASGAVPPVTAYDAVVVAASVHRRRHQPTVGRFVRANRVALTRRPTAFFSVSLSAAGSRTAHQADARGCADAFLVETGWRPSLVRLVAGELAYTRYPALTRWVLRLIAWRAGGATDTSRDHEYTDWKRLRSDVETFLLEAVPAPAPRVEIPVAAG
jgi:menaquinone-dependent protoporphyrinogen oxidase